MPMMISLCFQIKPMMPSFVYQITPMMLCCVYQIMPIIPSLYHNMQIDAEIYI